MVATKSILKNVVIKDKNSAKKLAKALEQAKNRKDRDGSPVVSFSYASDEDIKKMFAKKSE